MHELLICAHISTEECLKDSIQKIQHTQRKPRCSTVSTFSFFPEIPFFYLSKSSGWTIRSPGKPEIPTFSQEPHMHWALQWEIRRPQMWSDQINGSSLDWKTRSVLSWTNQFCFGTYVHAKQIFQLIIYESISMYINIFICTSKQLVSSLCVDQNSFLNAFVLEGFLNVFFLVASNGIFFNAVCSSVHFDQKNMHGEWCCFYGDVI